MAAAAQPIRVLIVDMPKLLREIVGRALEDEPRVEVVGVLPASADLAEATCRLRAAVLVMGEDHPDARDPWLTSSGRRSVPKLLSVAADGRHSSLSELRPHRVALGELSPDALVGAVLSAATH